MRLTYGHQIQVAAADLAAAPAAAQSVPAAGTVPEGCRAYRLNVLEGSVAVRCEIEWGASCGPNRYALYNLEPILHHANTPFVLGVRAGDNLRVRAFPLVDPNLNLTNLQIEWGYSFEGSSSDRIPATELVAGGAAGVLVTPKSAEFLTLDLADANFLWHGHGVNFREAMVAGVPVRVKGPSFTTTVPNVARFWQFGAQG